MIQALFEALSAGLGIWKSKESRKYLDKLMKLEKKYYEAINKSEEDWDDAVLDNIALIPRLEQRTLRISRKIPGMEYKYCVKYKFLSSKCKEWKIDYYDLTDEKIKDKLINMGFVLKVRSK